MSRERETDELQVTDTLITGEQYLNRLRAIGVPESELPTIEPETWVHDLTPELVARGGGTILKPE